MPRYLAFETTGHLLLDISRNSAIATDEIISNVLAQWPKETAGSLTIKELDTDQVSERIQLLNTGLVLQSFLDVSIDQLETVPFEERIEWVQEDYPEKIPKAAGFSIVAGKPEFK